MTFVAFFGTGGPGSRVSLPFCRRLHVQPSLGTQTCDKMPGCKARCSMFFLMKTTSVLRTNFRNSNFISFIYHFVFGTFHQGSNKFVASSQFIAKAHKSLPRVTLATNLFCLCRRTHVLLGSQVCVALFKVQPAMM